MSSREPRIDAYLRKLPPFSQEICQELRDLIHETDPEMTEAWKWGPNFSHEGMVCGFGAFKQWVTLTFFKGSLMKDTGKLFQAGFQNAHNRSIKFTTVKEIPVRILKAYIREAVRLNKQGVSVPAPVRRTSSQKLPESFGKILRQKNLLALFEERPPYQKRDYVRWIASPKRAETISRRFQILIEDLKTGMYMNMKYKK